MSNFGWKNFVNDSNRLRQGMVSHQSSLRTRWWRHKNDQFRIRSNHWSPGIKFVTIYYCFLKKFYLVGLKNTYCPSIAKFGGRKVYFENRFSKNSLIACRGFLNPSRYCSYAKLNFPWYGSELIRDFEFSKITNFNSYAVGIQISNKTNRSIPTAYTLIF